MNCQGDHPAYSRSCPKWATEKEIQEVKVKQGVSYPDASKLVEGHVPRAGVIYAADLKQVKDCSTRTDSSILQEIILQTQLNQRLKIVLNTRSTRTNCKKMSLRRNQSIKL